MHKRSYGEINDRYRTVNGAYTLENISFFLFNRGRRVKGELYFIFKNK
jgi:hypothetical protein